MDRYGYYMIFVLFMQMYSFQELPEMSSDLLVFILHDF